MKKIKLFAVAAMLAVSTAASAQFTNTAAASPKTAASTDGWGTFYVQYNPVKMSYKDDDDDNLSFKGFSVGYDHAFSVSKSIPLFVEAGLGLQYLTYKDEEDDEYYSYEDKVNMLSLKVPVSLVYRWDIPGGKVSLMPFAGIALRFNVMGKKTMTESYGDGDSEEEEIDLFDKDDAEEYFGDEDYAWKRFQMGWQIGVKASISNFVLGVSYGGDFSEITEDAKLKTTSITLGYRF